MRVAKGLHRDETRLGEPRPEVPGGGASPTAFASKACGGDDRDAGIQYSSVFASSGPASMRKFSSGR